MKTKEIYCEKSYLERIKENYREHGMLYHFYLWIKEIRRKNKK
tara:strand:- start:288 stop:416 length:129 start_codon:yes stop_codon:yes gene_type:complete